MPQINPPVQPNKDFDQFGEQIASGTTIGFDAYLANGYWIKDEHKAFMEAAKSNSWNYQLLAFCLVSRQASVIILS